MYPSVRFSLIKRIFVFPIHQEDFDDAVRTLVEYQAHWPDVEAAFLGIRRPLHSPPTDRSASYRNGHGSGSPVPKKRSETEATGTDSILNRGVCCHSRSACARPL